MTAASLQPMRPPPPAPAVTEVREAAELIRADTGIPWHLELAALLDVSADHAAFRIERGFRDDARTRAVKALTRAYLRGRSA